jgi:predicted Rossmann fold flavoprotein
VQTKKIVVVGGGPAGMMAAIRAARFNQDVTLIEKNPTLGRKLLLSGKGRCNLTNSSHLDEFLSRFSDGGEFLRDAFKKFFNQELMDFFQARGLKLKVERQGRVFPLSDSSVSVREILKKELLKNKVKIIYQTRLKDILVQAKSVKAIVLHDGKVLPVDRVILATGGVSYAFTGSTGEGLDLAKRLGHRIMPLKPGLVALRTRQGMPRLLEGLTLKNIRLSFIAAAAGDGGGGRKQIVSEIGELLFTDFGISGPLVLSLSGRIIDWLNEDRGVFVSIDLKPALSREQLDARCLREFSRASKRSIRRVMWNLLPRRLGDEFLNCVKISLDKSVSQITHKERAAVVSLLKDFRLDITGSLPIEEAMVTRGGVSRKDINPRTMESRKVLGLYFAGEMIDIDADTGGFNLQAAFSTGYLAGESASLN